MELRLSVTSVVGRADYAAQLPDKYGTYEVQPTADTENPFPKIAQGLPSRDRKGPADKAEKEKN